MLGPGHQHARSCFIWWNKTTKHIPTVPLLGVSLHNKAQAWIYFVLFCGFTWLSHVAANKTHAMRCCKKDHLAATVMAAPPRVRSPCRCHHLPSPSDKIKPTPSALWPTLSSHARTHYSSCLSTPDYSPSKRLTPGKPAWTRLSWRLTRKSRQPAA